jgi:hypothetical protein
MLVYTNMPKLLALSHGSVWRLNQNSAIDCFLGSMAMSSLLCMGIALSNRLSVLVDHI